MILVPVPVGFTVDVVPTIPKDVVSLFQTLIDIVIVSHHIIVLTEKCWEL